MEIVIGQTVRYNLKAAEKKTHKKDVAPATVLDVLKDKVELYVHTADGGFAVTATIGSKEGQFNVTE